MRQRNLVSIVTRAFAVVVALAAFVAVTPSALAKPQATCPVMGGDIDKNVFVDHEGQRVYFCCPGCIGKFEAEPGKYLAKLKADGVELEKTPAGAGATTDARGCGCEQGKACGCGADCTCGKDGSAACGTDCACHKGAEKHGCQAAGGEKKDCGCGK